MPAASSPFRAENPSERTGHRRTPAPRSVCVYVCWVYDEVEISFIPTVLFNASTIGTFDSILRTFDSVSTTSNGVGPNKVANLQLLGPKVYF